MNSHTSIHHQQQQTTAALYVASPRRGHVHVILPTYIPSYCIPGMYDSSYPIHSEYSTKCGRMFFVSFFFFFRPVRLLTFSAQRVTKCTHAFALRTSTSTYHRRTRLHFWSFCFTMVLADVHIPFTGCCISLLVHTNYICTCTLGTKTSMLLIILLEQQQYVLVRT